MSKTKYIHIFLFCIFSGITVAQPALHRADYETTFLNSLNMPILANDRFYYPSNVPNFGNELITCDLNLTNTSMPKNIAAGAVSSSPKHLEPIGSKVVFTADDGLTGVELYVSDGTNAGTFRIADQTPGAASTFSNGYSLNFGNFALFSTTSGSSEIYATDGTVAGTKLAINSSQGNYAFSVGGKAILYANSSTDSLYLYDYPTNAKTYLTKFNSGSWSINYGYRPKNIATSGNKFVIGFGTQILVSDGTTAGSYLVSQIGGQNFSNATEFSFFDGKLYFVAFTTLYGTELYSVNLQNRTANLESNINKRNNNTSSGNPSSLTIFNDSLFFIADDGFIGIELYKMKGEGGLNIDNFKLVQELVPGIQGIGGASIDSVQGNLLINRGPFNQSYTYKNGSISLSGHKIYNYFIGSATEKSTSISSVVGLNMKLAIFRNQSSGSDSLVWLKNDGSFIYLQPTFSFNQNSLMYNAFKAGNRVYLPSGTNQYLWYFDLLTQKSDLESFEAISLFPNPALQTFSINSSSSVTNIEVTDCLGRQKFVAIPPAGQDIDIQHLPTGIYWISITTSHGRVVRKLIKE